MYLSYISKSNHGIVTPQILSCLGTSPVLSQWKAWMCPLISRDFSLLLFGDFVCLLFLSIDWEQMTFNKYPLWFFFPVASLFKVTPESCYLFQKMLWTGVDSSRLLRASSWVLEVCLWHWNFNTNRRQLVRDHIRKSKVHCRYFFYASVLLFLKPLPR